MKQILKKRDLSIDLLRFLAIILMVFSHSNTILGIKSNNINFFFQQFADSFCFIAFVFCFGASYYYSRKESNQTNLKRFFKRLGLIYLSYCVVTIIFLISKNTLNILNIFQYLSFYKLPEYGEFFTAFILFEVFLFFSHKILFKISKNMLNVVAFGLIFFVIGLVFSKLDFGNFTFLQLLFFGKENAYSFPVFQYFIVILFGMYTAINGGFQNFPVKKAALILVAFISMSVICSLLAPYVSTLSYLRWPPSISFIIINLMYVFGIITLYKFFVEKTNTQGILYKITKPSHHIILLFWFHLVLLFILKSLSIPNEIFMPYLITILIISIMYLYDYIRQKKIHENI